MVERVRKEIPDKNFLIGSKISMWEGFPGGQGSAGPDTAIMDLTEPLDLAKGIEERGASFVIQSAGSPSITLALSQPDKAVPDQVYLHHTFQKALKDVLKPETVVIASAYCWPSPCCCKYDPQNNIKHRLNPASSSTGHVYGIVFMGAIGHMT